MIKNYISYKNCTSDTKINFNEKQMQLILLQSALFCCGHRLLNIFTYGENRI